MRAKKLIFSGILITTAMLFLGSCGKATEPANAEPTETVKEADAEERLEGAGNSAPVATEKPTVTAEPTQTPAPAPTEKPAETAKPTQTPAPAPTGKPAETAKPTQTPAPAATEKPAETAKPTQTPAPAPTEKPAETAKPTQTPAPTEKPAETAKPTQTPAPAPTEKPAVTAEPTQAPAVTEAPVEEPNTEQPVETQKPVPPAQPEVPAQPETPAQPSQPEQPAHQHTWQDHVVTTQTWISNIVVVEDYGEIPGEAYGVAVCSCGYETEDKSAIESHVETHIDNEEFVNFTTQTRYRESTYGVIGTHEEDQGHYETISYVDYQYCDCGETK